MLNTLRRSNLHSPLTLGITDSLGNYTGMDPVTHEINEEIPNVYYKQIGDVQFISVPTDTPYTLTMHGYDTGTFALDVDKQLGNTITESTSFQNVPTTAHTLATVAITPNLTVATTQLQVDTDGNGTTDTTLTATPNGTTTYDTTPPELHTVFDPTTRTVTLSATDTIDPSATYTKVGNTLTLEDTAGNTTTIPLMKYEQEANKLAYKYTSLTRNTITTHVPPTTIKYEWDTEGTTLKQLDTKSTIAGIEQYIFAYKGNIRHPLNW